MMQIVIDFLYGFVGFVCVHICGEATFIQSLDVDTQQMGDETLAPVLRQGGPHPYLSCLVHQGPRYRGALRPQQADGEKVADTLLNESLAPLVATKMPELIHQGSVGNIHG